jgi:hypothetical protein
MKRFLAETSSDRKVETTTNVVGRGAELTVGEAE